MKPILKPMMIGFAIGFSLVGVTRLAAEPRETRTGTPTATAVDAAVADAEARMQQARSSALEPRAFPAA